MTDTVFSRWSVSGIDGLRSFGDQLESDEPALFRAEGRRWSFADMLVSDVSQTATRVRPAVFDAAQQRYVSVTFVRNGLYELFDNDRRFTFRAGDAGYMRGWDQVSAANPVPSRVAMLSIHEDRLAEHGVHVSDRIGAFHSSARLRGPALSFVVALMDEAADAEGDMIGTPATAAVLIQLVAGLFLEDSAVRADLGRYTGDVDRQIPPAPVEAAQLGSALLVRADGVISSHAADPAFGPSELAATLNISLRQLQRVFNHRGSTPAEAIRARRLDTAVDALRHAHLTDRSVAEVAALSGFSSVKELRFALRLSYGVTPREFLAGLTG